MSLSPTIMYSERIEGGLSVVLAHFVSHFALLIKSYVCISNVTGRLINHEQNSSPGCFKGRGVGKCVMDA